MHRAGLLDFLGQYLPKYNKLLSLAKKCAWKKFYCLVKFNYV